MSRFDGTNFVNFTREDGLPGNDCIFATSSPDGVMWFGMNRGGAARYDAKTFSSFTAADGLTENSAFHSLAAPDGTLWFTYGLDNVAGGATRFDGSKFTSFSARDGLPRLVNQMTAAPAGDVWFGTAEGLVHYDNKQFTRLTVADGLPSDVARSVARALDGSLWVATDKGISHYADGKFKNYGPADGLIDTEFNRAFCDTKGRLWFGNAVGPTGAVLFDGTTFQTLSATNGLAGIVATGFCSDPDGTVWIGTDGGVSCFAGEKFVATYRRAKDRLPQSFVRAVFRDSRGVLWFGTSAGATRFDGNVWSTLTTKDGLIGNDVRTICEDKAGAIWFGTSSGITRYRPGPSTASTRGHDRWRRRLAPSTILVADDVALNRQLVAGYFEGTAHKLITATNGLEAIEEAERHRPDVILMDMRMPELDGHATTKRLKANPALKHIPVIAVTASSFCEEEARARKICDGFIRKPFSRAELIAELGRFLKLAHARETSAITASVSAPTSPAGPVPSDALARRPALVAALREQQRAVWPELCQSLAMDEIETFARRLKSWGEQGQWPEVRDYAMLLERQVQEFDLAHLPKTLQGFAELCDRLSRGTAASS